MFIGSGGNEIVYEMLKIVKHLLLLVGLLYFAWKDYHTLSIKVMPTIILGIFGAGINFFLKGSQMMG